MYKSVWQSVPARQEARVYLVSQSHPIFCRSLLMPNPLQTKEEVRDHSSAEGRIVMGASVLYERWGGGIRTTPSFFHSSYLSKPDAIQSFFSFFSSPGVSELSIRRLCFRRPRRDLPIFYGPIANLDTVDKGGWGSDVLWEVGRLLSALPVPLGKAASPLCLSLCI